MPASARAFTMPPANTAAAPTTAPWPDWWRAFSVIRSPAACRRRGSASTALRDQVPSNGGSGSPAARHAAVRVENRSRTDARSPRFFQRSASRRGTANLRCESAQVPQHASGEIVTRLAASAGSYSRCALALAPHRATRATPARRGCAAGRGTETEHRQRGPRSRACQTYAVRPCCRRKKTSRVRTRQTPS